MIKVQVKFHTHYYKHKHCTKSERAYKTDFNLNIQSKQTHKNRYQSRLQSET